jgi:hypothetical protein
MKLNTKKREMKAKLDPLKIMGLIKRVVKIQDIRLGKIKGHICTDMIIKLKENKRNIELFTNKHKVVTMLIHIGNDQGPLENL